MPDVRMSNRGCLGAALLLGAATLTALGPAASAQTEDPGPPPAKWEGSTFDDEFEEFEVRTPSGRLEPTGTFRFKKPQPNSEITGAVVGIADDEDDDYELREECNIPAPTAFSGDGPAADTTDTLPFGLKPFQLNCNGRYLLSATATVNVQGEPAYTMLRSVLVEMTPASIEHVDLELDATRGRVAVEWTGLDEDELAIDAIGYAIQRAGPADEDGVYGDFEDIEVLDLEGRTRHIDQLDDHGTYRYRVRSLRDGPLEPVRSSILTSGVSEVNYDPPPPTTTVTTTSRPPPTQVGNSIPPPRPRPRPTFGPATTIDTGFDETLGYDTSATIADVVREPVELPDEEIAAGGQSVVYDEGEETNLLVPAAGALVMIIWAGHLIYLNRLAKEL